MIHGHQRPRIKHVPASARPNAGRDAVDLARHAGLVLDPWEEDVLLGSLGEGLNGKWTAKWVGLNAPRQNGKNAILEARELAGLFLFGEELIIHSAHQFDTAMEAFRRLETLVRDNPDFMREVKARGIKHSHGEEGIELKSGARIRFKTRTKSGARGFTGDCLILDEAMIIAETFHGTLLPTLAAKSMHGDPQVWYTGSSVDKLVHEHGMVFARVRKRAITGEDPDLAYFEWSADGEIEDAVRVADSREAWAQANPGLGIRISEEHIARERRAMDLRSFAVERLGIGDWPDPDEELQQRISLDEWDALVDKQSATTGPVCFAFDVTPDRRIATISVVGMRADGRRHGETVDARPGTGWVIDRLEQLVAEHESVETGVVYDASGPAASLQKGLEELAKRGVTLKGLNAPEYAQACGMLVDACKQDVLRHLGSAELSSAIRAAAVRPLGDAWAWSRKNSTGDISPLVAVTLALWGLNSGLPTRSVYEDRGVLVV